MAIEMLESSTQAAYKHAYEKLKTFLEKEKKELLDWLAWWHDRRTLIFRAFVGQNGPRSNQAEVVHASWKNRGEIGLSLSQAAEFDTKDSLLEEENLRKMKNSRKGTGSGPDILTKNARDKQRQMSAASRAGRDLLAHGVVENESTSAPNPTTEPDGSDAPRKKKRRTNTQRMFESRCTAAIESSMKVKKIKRSSKKRHVFDVTNNSNSKTNYEVQISSVPSCTCSDFRDYGTKVFCPHILFILLVVLKGNDLKEAMKNRFLSDDYVKNLLSNQVEEKFKISNAQRRERRHKDFPAILQRHEDYEKAQTWRAHKKSVRAANCTNYKCKASLKRGTDCLVVDALTVRFDQEKASPQLFYYCLNSSCHKHQPKWTNIRGMTEEYFVNETDIEQSQILKLLGLQ